MKLSVYKPDNQPMSFRIISENVLSYLNKYYEIQYFCKLENIPKSTDLIWDPNVGGGYVSDLIHLNTKIPVIITLHGTRLFSLKIKELKNKNLNSLRIIKSRFYQRRLWKKHKYKFKKIVTVSNYSKEEIIQYLKLKAEYINVIYNAVHHKDFYYNHNSEKSYLLHISEYQPVKNLDRIIEAYINAREKKEIPDLLILSRRFNKHIDHPNIKILDDRFRETKELVKLYQEAKVFIFPSLHEGFGIPIIESMACGTPVITSNTTACSETALESAVLVNPKKVDEIEEAIIKLCTDKDLYDDLQKKGLKRAQFFQWEKTADQYHTIFKSIFDEKE